LTAILDL